MSQEGPHFRLTYLTFDLIFHNVRLYNAVLLEYFHAFD